MLLAIAAASAWLAVHRHPYFRRRRVEAMIQRYRNAPDPTLAGELAEAVFDCRTEQPQRMRIVRLLSGPVIVARRAYRTDMHGGFRVKLPPTIALLKVTGRGLDGELRIAITDLYSHQRCLLLDRTYVNPVSSGMKFIGDPELFVRYEPPYPLGEWKADIPYKVLLKFQPVRRERCWPAEGSFPRNLIPTVETVPVGEPITCEYEDVLRVRLNFVPPDEAEQMPLIDDAQADRAMRCAIRVTPAPAIVTRPGAYAIQIDITNLPARWTARAWYRDPEGLEILLPRPPIKFEAGATDAVVIPLHAVYFEPSGSRVRLLLKPAPELEYYDPRAKPIWAGTIEIPITVAVPTTQPAEERSP